MSSLCTWNGAKFVASTTHTHIRTCTKSAIHTHITAHEQKLCLQSTMISCRHNGQIVWYLQKQEDCVTSWLHPSMVLLVDDAPGCRFITWLLNHVYKLRPQKCPFLNTFSLSLTWQHLEKSACVCVWWGMGGLNMTQIRTTVEKKIIWLWSSGQHDTDFPYLFDSQIVRW